MVGVKAQPERERKRENGDAKTVRRIGYRGGGEKARWIGEGRRQPARRMPLLAAARFWDRLGSVESGQPSGRRHSSSRCSRSAFFRGLTSRSLRSRRDFRYFLFTFHLSTLYSSVLLPIASVRAVHLHPPITPTPRRARARAHANLLCCL